MTTNIVRNHATFDLTYLENTLVIASTKPSLFNINGFAFYAFVCLVHVQSVKKYKCKKAYGKIEFCSFARKVRVFIKALDFGISPIIRWMH